MIPTDSPAAGPGLACRPRIPRSILLETESGARARRGGSIRLQETLHLPQVGLEGDAHDPRILDLLAARAAVGEAAAFEQIYLLLVDDLYVYVRGQCRNDAVAEDVVSSVFLKAWKSAKHYRAGSDSFRRWIFTIARNEMRDHWRLSQRTFPLPARDFEDRSAPESPEPSPETRAGVTRALSLLTEDQRQVIVLRYFNGKSNEEIARVMSKREGAVRALQMRALQHMRRLMFDAAP